MGALSVADLGDGSKPIGPAVPTVVERFPSEYTDFFRRELRPLVALAAAIAGTGRAEEIAQEALLRAHRRLGPDQSLRQARRVGPSRHHQPGHVRPTAPGR